MNELINQVRIPPKKALLQILREAAPQRLSSVDLITQYGYEDDLEISIYAKELLADGEPIGISCCEGHWGSLCCSDAPLRLWYSDTPEQLDEVKEMMVSEITALQAILGGLAGTAGVNVGAQKTGT